LSKKKRNPVVYAVIISCSVVFASVVIWIGICWWDTWVGLTLLYTLLPAAAVFACLTVVITAVVSSRRTKEAEVIALDAPIKYTSVEPQQQKYCPNCGTPYTLDLKQCANCAYEL